MHAQRPLPFRIGNGMPVRAPAPAPASASAKTQPGRPAQAEPPASIRARPVGTPVAEPLT